VVKYDTAIFVQFVVDLTKYKQNVAVRFSTSAVGCLCRMSELDICAHYVNVIAFRDHFLQFVHVSSLAVWDECVLCTMCMKWTHIEPVLSVCLRNSRTAGRIWMTFGMDVMPLWSIQKSWFLVASNWWYQYGGRTDLWGGIDTSAAFSRAT
jgi:hypothetical protein